MDASVFAFNKPFYITQLQGILHDICNVYVLLSQTRRRVLNDENDIRDAFGDYLQDDTYKNTTTGFVRYYQVDTEARERPHGRTDIRFLQVMPYLGQNVYFTIECKRIDGQSRLCKEYVEEGIRRFTTGKYPTHLGCNAMLGFVVCAVDLGVTVGKVNSYMAPSEKLTTQSASMTKMVRLESQHNAPFRFILYHLWMDFSNLIDTSKQIEIF